ncbi:MAG: hypothetical protein Q9184_005820 [Pyrenodesmia sp. 2 TL-2023]
MSGIEVAGIALAVFPVLVGGLNQMVAGIENIKRWRRYKLKLEEYALILESAQVYFFDTLDELLNDIIPSDEELELLIIEPLGTLWKQPQYDQKLHDRLDRSYRPYLKTVQTLVEKLKTMCEKLGVDTTGAVKWDNYSTIERGIQRMKVTFSKSVYKELLDDIYRANKDLREFTHQNISLEPVKRKRRSKRPIAELQLIRQYAASLYQVLMTDKWWKCDCKMYHMASLRLEARPQTIGGIAPKQLGEHSFHLLMSVTGATSGTSTMPEWKEIEVLPSIASSVSMLVANADPGATCIKGRPTRRGVRFAPETDACLSKPPHEVGPADTDLKRIEDICSAIRASNKDQTEIGLLIDETPERHQHKLYRANTVVGSETLSRSLEDLLRSSRDLGAESLSRKSRLQIAVTLASSVLQLSGTSWLKASWNSCDIFFHDKSGGPLASEQLYPYLSWQSCCCDVSPLVEQLGLDNHMIRSETLLALGLTLVELCFGRTLAEMRKPEDIHTNETATRLKTATRLHNRVYNEMGIPYGDVVRRCLFQTFDVRELSLDIEEVQQKVLDNVVTPLVEDLNSFNRDIRI